MNFGAEREKRGELGRLPATFVVFGGAVINYHLVVVIVVNIPRELRIPCFMSTCAYCVAISLSCDD